LRELCPQLSGNPYHAVLAEVRADYSEGIHPYKLVEETVDRILHEQRREVRALLETRIVPLFRKIMPPSAIGFETHYTTMLVNLVMDKFIEKHSRRLLGIDPTQSVESVESMTSEIALQARPMEL